MKNVILKSSQIFVLMGIMNFLMSVLVIYILEMTGGSFGMLPFVIFLECVFTVIVALITVLLFRKNYNSVLRIAVLFEVIYLISLVLTGFNPFGLDYENIYCLIIYLNSFIVVCLIYFGDNFISSKQKS